jgi:hypothetical protein
MGRAITTEELSWGHFPKNDEGHQAAGQWLMEGVRRLGEEHGLEGLSYMIHGSVGVGQETERSDIDFVAVYPKKLCVMGLEMFLPMLRRVHAEFYIPVEYNIISDEEAALGFHRIGPMFRDYLQQAQDQSHFVEGRPADAIVIPNGEDYELDMAGYLVRKRDTFAQALTNYSGDVDWHRFGRALELPRALSKKYRQLGEKSLTRQFVPTELANRLGYIDRRVTELTEIVASTPHVEKENVNAYEVFVKHNYLEAIKVAALMCLSQCTDYQHALAVKRATTTSGLASRTS